MLTRIVIKDFALIEMTEFEPESGLVIISGETGAGKSILIDAIGALLGNRLSREMIRHDQEKASVEAQFLEADKYLPDELVNELDLDENGELILSREINNQGRGLCRINGRMVNQSYLKQVVGYLIDIHGQNDQQTIFRQETHLKLLDRYGGTSIDLGKSEWNKQRQVCLDIKEQLDMLGRDPEERARQIDLLAYQIDELERAALKPNEEEKLIKRQKLLSSLERIQENLSGALDLISADEDDGIPALLAQSCAYLEFPARHLEPARNISRDLAAMIDQIAVYASDLRDLQERYRSQPDELEKVQYRLDLISKLKRKYGKTVDDVILYLEMARAKYQALQDGEKKFGSLRDLLEKELSNLNLAAEKLMAKRADISSKLELEIARQLQDLGMKEVKFKVDLTVTKATEENLNRTDCCQAAFMISPNAGEPLKPLVKIASGGEASRVLLAIKTILADADSLPVLIFDEIDTGVSGHTASMVARKLKQISCGRQIMCITHMAQIAAKADQHLLIEKTSDGIHTSTDLIVLDHEARLKELARLLSGGIADHQARELAEKLMIQ
ncbi:MAG: repair protein RecN [Clostridiales bacterium]|nr:repair protein RecN [Clostridiales bacterium]